LFCSVVVRFSRYNHMLRAGRPGFSSRQEQEIFFTASRPTLGPTQPPIQWLPGVKRLGREADHSPPSSTEVKTVGIIFAVPIYLHGVVLSSSSTGKPLPFLDVINKILLGILISRGILLYFNGRGRQCLVLCPLLIPCL
jgi:hypothetical protein